MVVDGEEGRVRGSRGVAEPDRRAAAVRADLDPRRPRYGHRSRERRRVQRVTLVLRHESLRRQRELAECRVEWHASRLGRLPVGSVSTGTGAGRRTSNGHACPSCIPRLAGPHRSGLRSRRARRPTRLVTERHDRDGRHDRDRNVHGDGIRRQRIGRCDRRRCRPLPPDARPVLRLQRLPRPHQGRGHRTSRPVRAPERPMGVLDRRRHDDRGHGDIG